MYHAPGMHKHMYHAPGMHMHMHMRHAPCVADAQQQRRLSHRQHRAHRRPRAIPLERGHLATHRARHGRALAPRLRLRRLGRRRDLRTGRARIHGLRVEPELVCRVRVSDELRRAPRVRGPELEGERVAQQGALELLRWGEQGQSDGGIDWGG